MKKPEPFQLTIPTPCHENWDEMTPAQGGNFCGSCQKTVIDFTRKSDAEVLAYFSAHQRTKTCGRFREDQTKIYAIPPTPKHSGFWPIFLGMVLSIWTGIKGNAQTKTTNPTTNPPAAVDSKKIPLVVGKISKTIVNQTSKDSEVSTNTIKGRITAAHGQTHLSGIIISIFSSKVQTVTNENGEFLLQIPDSLQGKAFTLVVTPKDSSLTPHQTRIDPGTAAYTKKGILITLQSPNKEKKELMGEPRMVPINKEGK